MSVLHYTTVTIAAPVVGGHNGGKSQLNMNGGELEFLNLLKFAQGWGTITGGAYPDPHPTTGFNFDANNYPRRIPAGTGGVQTLLQMNSNMEHSWADITPGVKGACTLTWDGGGTVTISGFTLVSGSLTSAPGSSNNLVTLRPTTNRPSIGVSAVTSITDYPHNMNLYYTTDQADVTAGKILSAACRLRWGAMKVGYIRFLNWCGGNDSMMSEWADRRPVGAISYNDGQQNSALYAGPTNTTSQDHYSLTFTHPVYGNSVAVDKMIIYTKWDSNQVGTASYLTYNGQQNLILNKFCSPANPSGPATSSGVPANGYYTVLRFDALLQGWINYSSGNLAPGTGTFVNGVPPEICLQAAIELGAHPWFIMPPYSADSGTGIGQITDFMSNMIDMVRAGAPAWMVPIFEPVNEWWNSQGAWNVYPWANLRQAIRYGGPIPGAANVAPFLVTSFTYDARHSVTATGAGVSGKVRLTVASTTGMVTGQIRTVDSVGGTVEANGVWPITVIDGTHLDLDGSTFVNAFTSGGTVSGQATMQSSGPVPPFGAPISTQGAAQVGVSGFSEFTTGYVTAVSGSSFSFDSVPSVGTWSGASGAATLTLVGSTVSVPYATQTMNTIVFSTTGALPAPLVAGTVYFVRTGGAANTPFQIALTYGGAAIDFSAGTQSGTHTSTLVVSLVIGTTDYHNQYGRAAAQLGQLLASKYGTSSPKTQTAYCYTLGMQTGTGSTASSAISSNPRMTSKYYVINTGSAANMAKFYNTHINVANYWGPSAQGTPQETTLANAWNGTLFTAGIVNGVMTVASFQNAGTQNMANGQVVFGQGLPPPFGGSQVTIVSGPGSGPGTYTLSNLTINVDSGTQLHSGASYAALQEYIDSTNSTQFTATISDGSGSAGNQMVVSSVVPASPGFGPNIYPTNTLNGVPITLATTITSQFSGTTGQVGTYIINRNWLVATPTTFFTNGVSSHQQDAIYFGVWKAWALGFGTKKMLFYEGGYSPDYSSFNTSASFPKVDMLRASSKWVVNCSAYPAKGTYDMLLQNFAVCDALTDGSFTATAPSHYLLDGRYPSNNAWALWENMNNNNTPPMAAAIAAYNA